MTLVRAADHIFLPTCHTDQVLAAGSTHELFDKNGVDQDASMNSDEAVRAELLFDPRDGLSY